MLTTTLASRIANAIDNNWDTITTYTSEQLSKATIREHAELLGLSVASLTEGEKYYGLRVWDLTVTRGNATYTFELDEVEG